MSLFRFTPGETAREIPGATWNALVDGEERDAKRGPGNVRGPEGGGFVVPPSPCRLQIVNRSGVAVPTGGVLKVAGVHVEPSTEFGAEYAGPIFKGEKPVAGDLQQTMMIASEPIRVDGVGWATITGAAFAKVNITSASHSFAKPKAAVEEFDSDSAAGYPIVWKETATGADKWAVVLLGGGSSSSTAWGQLVAEVPPNSILESESLKLEAFDGEWFGFVYDPPDSINDADIVKIWVANHSLNTTVRGSVADPLRVFGEIFSVERTEGEETVTKQVFLILGYLDPLVGAKGFVKSPDNDRGQSLIHHDGQSETVADGGPCGNEEEPPP